MKNADLGALLNAFNKVADEARRQLEAEQAVWIEPLDFQDVLASKLGLTFSVDLVYQDLTQDKILNALAGTDFRRLHGEVVASLELEEDILPKGLFLLLTEAEAKVKNQIWRVHKGDADPFPSDPHATGSSRRQRVAESERS